jgi:fumarate hydratase class I
VATVIKEEDLVQSVSDALQYIACYHPPDFVRALAAAYESEKSPAARDAIAQILVNSRLCAEGGRPMCQDTGVVNVFLEIGMNVRWDAAHDPEAMVNEGVRRAWTDAHNPLRASIVDDPAGARRNTGDNAPAVIHTRIVAGDKLSVTVAAKGGGSENKAQFAVLNPADSVADWVVETVPKLGAGWCPPGMLGVGFGGSAE